MHDPRRTTRTQSRNLGAIIAIALVSTFGLPDSVGAKPGGTGSSRFELRGILDFGGEQSFSLHDRENNATQWIDLGRSIGGYRVETYNSNNKTLTLASDAETLQLRLQEADGIPLAVISGSTDHTTNTGLKPIEFKRPPRPKFSQGQSAERSSRLSAEVRKGVPNAAIDRSPSNPEASLGREDRTATETKATPKTLQPAAPDSQRVQGQLSYELKVRPPMRIESIGER
ncbi:MAG: hypothetical protein GVY36_09530 [Verrucomicrobia bacterium]|nr:hypothetical protein [Verrucomicrobiota bacterium]